MKPLIFVLGTAPPTRRMVRCHLELGGYEVQEFLTPELIPADLPRYPVLVVLDGTTPDARGPRLCRQLRQVPSLADTPAILLTDGAPPDRTSGLHAGCDDCLSRFDVPGDLVVRVQTLLRHDAGPRPYAEHSRPQVLKVGDIEVDVSAMKVFVRGRDVSTTTLEFRLMEYLARHQGRVFTRDQLLDAVWGDAHFVTPRTVDACIRRIREKIEPDRSDPSYLRTIRGVGYRFDAGKYGNSATPASWDGQKTETEA